MKALNPMNHLGNNINVDVKYYNNEHKILFNEDGRYPPSVVEMLNNYHLSKTTYHLEVGDFLINYLFYLKKANPTEYSDRHSLSNDIHRAAYELESFIAYSNSNLHIWPGVSVMPVSVIERIGEAIGLSVISYVNEVTHADWVPVPILNVQACDYYLGYTKNGAVQVETKGAIVGDREYKESNVSQAKGSIIGKKNQTNKTPLVQYPCDYLYGTITCLDDDNRRMIKCWMVDPESVKVNYNLTKKRFSTRLNNALNIFEMVSPESKVTHRLKQVLREIDNDVDIKNLSNEPLIGDNGDASLERTAIQFFYRKSEVNNKTKDKGIWGVLDNQTLYFIGVKQDLVELVIKQNVNDLINYSREKITEEVKVTCKVLTKTDVKEYLKLTGKHVTEGEGISFEANGKIFTSSFGMIFGILRINSTKFKAV